MGTSIDGLTIGQARQLAAMFHAAHTYQDHGLCILAADRSWVFVGHVTESGDRFVMTGSRNVIRWGTTGGLEQLAEEGPLPDTRLGDSAAKRTIPREAVKFLVACNTSAWRGK